MTMTKRRVSLAACAVLGLAACSSDNNANPDGRTSPDGPTTPAKPTLGAQIDRMGRPAINTALDMTFSGDVMRDPAEDAYNADTAKASWPTTYKSILATQLAILDSLDGVCGNQLLAGPNPVAGRYDKLAGALADDQLYVDSSAAACTQYLAVEANATGVVPNSDCGGRMPAYDVILTTYSALAAGALTGVDDGVTNDNSFKTTFPWLGDAN
jgi:hypothetical protein